MVMTFHVRLIAAAIALLVAASWFAVKTPPPLSAQKGVPVYTFRVVNVYPHDPAAYTQGLLYREGFLYESTGLNGRSTLRKVKLETGEVLQQHRLEHAHSGEGLAAWN